MAAKLSYWMLRSCNGFRLTLPNVSFPSHRRGMRTSELSIEPYSNPMATTESG